MIVAVALALLMVCGHRYEHTSGIIIHIPADTWLPLGDYGSAPTG
jgi:hypothetical protein